VTNAEVKVRLLMKKTSVKLAMVRKFAKNLRFLTSALIRVLLISVNILCMVKVMKHQVFRLLM